MAEQRLLYSLEGDASGLKKALAEAEAAHRRLSLEMARKGQENGLMKAAEKDLAKVEAALATARQQLESFNRSAELGSNGPKKLAQDIAKAGKEVDRLTKKSESLNKVINDRGATVSRAGFGVLVAQEKLINAETEKHNALLRAARAETERLAAVERRRAADEAAATRAAQANARVKIAAIQQAAQAAQNEARITQAAQLQSGRGEVAVVQTRLLAQAQAQAFANAQRLTVATQQQNAAVRQSAESASAARGQFFSYAAALLSVGAAVKGINAITTAGVQLQALNSTLLFSTGSAEKAAAAYAFVRAEAERLGLPINVLGKQFGQLAAASIGTRLEGEATRKIFSSVASAARVMGLQTFQVERALLAVQQIMSKGNVQAEELRGQLGEQIPGAFNIAARAMGVTTAELNEMLKAGEVLSEDFLPKFAAELQRTVDPAVPAAVKTYAAEVERLKNTFQLFLQEVGNSGALEAISAQVVIVTQKLREMSDSGELQPAIDEIVASLSLLATGLAEVAEFVAKNGATILRLVEAYALFKVATIGIGLAKTAAEFGGLATATTTAAGAATTLSVALRAIAGLGIGAVFAFTADRLIKLVQVMREAYQIDEEIAASRRKRDDEIASAIRVNANYADTVVKSADALKNASETEKAAYAVALKSAQDYYRALAQRESNNGDINGPVPQAAINASRQSAVYRRALDELKGVNDARAKDEAAAGARIKKIKETETESIKIAVDAQIEHVKRAQRALRDSEKEIAAIAKRTAEFQKEFAAAGKPKSDEPSTTPIADASEKLTQARVKQNAGDNTGALEAVEDVRALIKELAETGQVSSVFLSSLVREAGQVAAAAGEGLKKQAETELTAEEDKLRQLNTLATQLANVKVGVDTEAAEGYLKLLLTRMQDFYKANPLIVQVIEQRKSDVDLGIEKAPKKATGGPIRGPGSGTSDSILMYGSNGEHMLTAKEVEAAGGHAQIYRLRALLRAGRLREQLPRFALGGAIQSQAQSISSRMRVAMALPMPDYGERISRSITLAMGNIPAYAAGGVIEGGPTNILNLNLPFGKVETRATDSQIAVLQRGMRLEALKYGRRK